MSRAAIIRALDALGDGDQNEAVWVLLEALEDNVTARHIAPPPCAVCGVRSWQPERHIYSRHHPAESLRRAA